MRAAVLIIAGGRPHYCDRPPVTEFYTLYSSRVILLDSNIDVLLRDALVVGELGILLGLARGRSP